jgi:hypothetical protein
MEKTIEFLIDGMPAGSSTLFIEDGKIDITNAEDSFYKAVRYSTQQLLDEEREYIFDNLTDAQEAKLKDAHFKDYHGPKEGYEESYDVWLEELDLETLKKILA